MHWHWLMHSPGLKCQMTSMQGKIAIRSKNDTDRQAWLTGRWHRLLAQGGKTMRSMAGRSICFLRFALLFHNKKYRERKLGATQPAKRKRTLTKVQASRWQRGPCAAWPWHCSGCPLPKSMPGQAVVMTKWLHGCLPKTDCSPPTQHLSCWREICHI